MNSELTHSDAQTRIRVSSEARAALVEYFTAQGLTFADGPNGEIVVPFELAGRRLLVTAQVTEQPDLGIWMKMISADPVAREHWAATLVAVNQWNILVRAPRAVLRVGDWDKDAEATLTLDSWLPLGAAGDTSQIEQVAETMFAASSYFATGPSPRAAQNAGSEPPG